MRRAAVLLSAMAVVLFTAGILAQGKTDFSGKWAPDADKNPAPAAPAGGGGGGGRGGGGGFGGPMTVTQDAKALSIAREGRNGGAAPAPQVYNLDGSDSKNAAGRGGDQVSNAKWDGAKLVITTHGQNGDTVQTWSMDGGDLVIERAIGGNNVKTYYKKQ